MKAIKLSSNAICFLSLVVSANALTQPYPSRPIQLVLGLAPGSLMDSSARVAAKGASHVLGVQFVVENKPGAGTMIASSLVAKARPDGYTLLLNGVAMSVNPSLFKEVPYDALRDFAPVAFLVNAPQILVVRPSLGVKTLSELLAKYRDSDSLNFAHPGVGTMPHLDAAVFQSRSGIQMQMVPYKGGAPALADLMAGHVDLLFTSPLSKPQIDSLAVRALAITSEARIETLPNVPTFAEAGLPLPDLNAGAWSGIFAPRGTPEAIVEKLNQTFNAVLQDPGAREEFRRLGQVPKTMTPEQFAAFMQEDMKRWPGIVAVAGVRAQ